MKKTDDIDQAERPARTRLKKETLRGLGFAELDAVRGGDPGVNGNNGHPRPIATRYCLE